MISLSLTPSILNLRAYEELFEKNLVQATQEHVSVKSTGSGFPGKGEAWQLSKALHTGALLPIFLSFVFLYPMSVCGCEGSNNWNKKKNGLCSLIYDQFCTYFLFFRD